MTLIPWLLVGLLLGALYIVWTLSKSRVEWLLEDLECEQSANAETQGELRAEIAKLKEKIENLPIPLPPAVPYKPTHRRPWPRPEGMRTGHRAVDTGTDIVDRSGYQRAPHDDKSALARLAMDCAVAHAPDCDCARTYRLLEHEASLGEGA